MEKRCELMNFSRKNTKKSSYILLLSGIAFLLYYAFTPPVYSIYEELQSGDRLTDHAKTMFGTMRQDMSFLLSSMNDNEILTDVVMQNYITRSMQSNRQKLSLFFDSLAILLMGYHLTKLIKRCYRPRNDQDTHLIALSKGGHAPPKLLYINNILR